ncbi:hypothetical protein KVR01_007907 [Diaporthe batatas]|uniref:uncharacterized protein n=1 Tax=Diaporthe batatas TaxID=748121 RepID=UPI001D04161E|nr:uncharacterized protein KVR01_007907 [Diaporthe batatas]KAG8162142.1 hypothetical protein KVR01_007907 [Diaporthe batatas]
MNSSKRQPLDLISSNPSQKKARTRESLQEDLPFGRPSASANTFALSQEESATTRAKDIPAAHVNYLESQSSEIHDSAKGIAAEFGGDDFLEISIEDLIAADIPGISDQLRNTNDNISTEVEVVVNDTVLDVSNKDLSVKNSYYETLGVPHTAENTPGECLLNLLQGEHNIKKQVDSVSDVLWDTWLSECRELGVPDDTLNNASKISGPARGNLHIIWHYPTYNVSRSMFGFTADPKNPCINFQNRKIGPNPRVCTNDIIPIRANYPRSQSNGVQWTSIIPNSAQVLSRSADLTIGLLNMARVAILVGQETYEIVKTRLESDPSKEIHQLYLPINVFNVFGEKPHVLAILCKATQQIENLFFISFHTQAFFYIHNPLIGVYFDFIWNAACAIANIPVISHDIFYQTVSSRQVRDKVTEKYGQLALAIMYRGMEKNNRVYLPEGIAEQIFHRTISSNIDWWAANSPNKGAFTVVQLILKLFSDKANSTSRRLGFPNLAKGRDTQRAGGWQSLKKATEAQRESGFNNQKKAQAVGHVSQSAQKVARLQAFLDTYQVRQLLSKPKSTLTSKELSTVESLQDISDCVQTRETTPKCRKFINTHVIFWLKKNPFGLRFKGDNAPANALSFTAY